MRSRNGKKRKEARRSGGDSRPERRFVNLKGEAQSYALLRCLMELGELPTGGVLEVLVGDEKVSESLSRFLGEEGHRVVELERVRPGVWKLDIEKGSE